MSIENFENESFLKIEKIKESNDSEMSFCPKRGGIITSMKIKGIELLYIDDKSFVDLKKNVRGGIPILWPMAGPKTNEGPFSNPNFKQHGFARNSENWKIGEAKENEFIEILESNDETKKIYPYEFVLKMKAKIEDDGSIIISQEVENKGENEMPISMGLHPYFNVPEGKMEEISFNFSGGDEIKKEIKEWIENGDGDFLKRIDNPKEEIKITIPGIGTINMNISEEYEKIWIWMLPDQNFICIEPVMRDNQNGEIVNGPKMIKSGETFSAEVKYSLEN